MMAEGYQVRLAKSGREVLYWTYHNEPLDLIILDLGLPDAIELRLLEKLEDRIPSLPVVIHAFPSDYANYPALIDGAAFVEKRGNSIDRLKKVVIGFLGKSHPKRSNATKNDKQRQVEP